MSLVSQLIKYIIKNAINNYCAYYTDANNTSTTYNINTTRNT